MWSELPSGKVSCFFVFLCLSEGLSRLFLRCFSPLLSSREFATTGHFHKYPDALASRSENSGGKLDILAPRHPDTFENAKYIAHDSIITDFTV